MRWISWGTRGSLPVAGRRHALHGGSTTCLEVKSDCLPSDMALVVDAGTGFLPFALALDKQVKRMLLLQTHYHLDHTFGFLIAPPVYNPGLKITIAGPSEHGKGPEEVYGEIMRPPHAPVPFESVKGHIEFLRIEHPTERVMVVHPLGGVTQVKASLFQKRDAAKGQISFGKKGSYDISECLVIRMMRSQHPENTFTFRFEERPTGKIGVFLTDDEARRSIPGAMKQFVSGAHVLLQDCQYFESEYDGGKAGFGHGTPEYCVNLATAGGVRRLYLTHHDPSHGDDDLERLLSEAADVAGRYGDAIYVEMAKDGMEIAFD